MPTCPVCHRRVPVGQLLTAYLRRFRCRTCGSTLRCDRTLGFLPGMAIILFGPILARAVREGAMPLVAAVGLGALLLVGAFLFALRVSKAHLIRERAVRNGPG